MSEALGGILIIALLFVGGLFLSGKAVLVYEEQQPPGPYSSPYKCTYFTGTRTVTGLSSSNMGCERFKNVSP